MDARWGSKVPENFSQVKLIFAAAEAIDCRMVEEATLAFLESGVE